MKNLFEENAILVTDTDWVKQNEEELYDWLLDEMEHFVNNEGNETVEEDLEDFENGNWLVEIVFRMNSNGDKVRLVTCGKNGQHLANQPAWLEETEGILGVDFSDLPYEKYQELL